MAKKEPGVLQINVHPNAVSVRGLNRETTIIRQEPSKVKFAAQNVIFIKSMTSDSGYNSGVTHEVSTNGKVKLSTIGLSYSGLMELYACLGHYLQGISDNSINYKQE